MIIQILPIFQKAMNDMFSQNGLPKQPPNWDSNVSRGFGGSRSWGKLGRGDDYPP